MNNSLRGVNTILSADPVISATFSPNTDTCAKGHPILILWESDDRPEEPFGELTASTGSSYNPYRFTGQQWDEDSGLYYLRDRYYACKYGRFISRDKLPNKSFSPYVYTRNPINEIDPSGLIIVPVIAGIIAGVCIFACGYIPASFLGILMANIKRVSFDECITDSEKAQKRIQELTDKQIQELHLDPTYSNIAKVCGVCIVGALSVGL